LKSQTNTKLLSTLALSGALITSPLFAADQLEVSGGVIEGTKAAGSNVRVFKGVPFAAAPVGERRWKAPEPVEPWDGVRKADRWGTHCMQGNMFGGPLVTRDESMAEDCLYLNVWTPAENADASLPVLVVFHGGGFAAGSGSEPRTDGEWMAQQGIVVVEPNYRLSIFGFLAHPELTIESEGKGSGNYGMLDQVAALQWVQDNIAAFGGNPDDVTINGESAGSMSVSALMASPLSRDMIHKAIGQSGAFFTSPSDSMQAKSLADKEKDGATFAQSIGAGTLADLRAMPADELLSAVMKQDNGWGYSPGIDGYFMPGKVAEIYAAGEQARIPLLAGWTSAELGMAVAFNPQKPTVETFTQELKKQFGERAEDALKVYAADTDQQAMESAAALASDLFISYSTWIWIETHKSTSQAPVYRYRFDRTIPGDPAAEFGAVHAVDIEYAFNTLDSKTANWQAEDRNLSKLMATALANFVRTGDPNGPGAPDWPEYGKSRKVMYFDSESKAAPEEFRSRYEFLDSVGERPDRFPG
jgi:para-nitrobenzyl esterase